MAIPSFRPDGYLPEGLHPATEPEVLFRFGTATKRRRRLALRLRRWIQLARDVGAQRFLADGSFVTAKAEPNDLDAVILLPRDFEEQFARGVPAALELESLFLSRRPDDLFAAETAAQWDEWAEFFGRAPGSAGRRKGLVEVML